MSNFKCNLIIPGFGKSGTSSLHEYLDIHPNICMSNPKETHFFAIDERYKKGYSFHNKIFEKCCEKQNVIFYGESSTIHSIWEPALDRIKADLYNPKIILLLRHPLDRLLSHYNWLWSLHIENRPLLKAVLIEKKNGFHPDKSLFGNYPCYLTESNYTFWCPLIVEKFGKENVFFLDSEELFRCREKALNKCFEFLNIHTIEKLNNIHINKTGDASIQRTIGLKYIRKITSLIPSSIKEEIDSDRKVRDFVWKYYLKISGKKKTRSKPILDQDDILNLKELLKEEISFYKRIFQK